VLYIKAGAANMARCGPLVKCGCTDVRICGFWNGFGWKLWT